jgi:hypothetical protein
MSARSSWGQAEPLPSPLTDDVALMDAAHVFRALTGRADDERRPERGCGSTSHGNAVR